MLLPLFACFLFIQACVAFYLPGVAPRDFSQGEEVDIKTNSLTSSKTLLPLDYYKTPLCQPEVRLKQSENLGEYMTGDRIENSPYTFKMNTPVSCQVLCAIDVKPSVRRELKRLIKQDYRVNLLVDNLPAFTQMKVSVDSAEPVYQKGFPVGFIGNSMLGEEGHLYVLNHLVFEVSIHPTGEDSYRVVGFQVRPDSKLHKYNGEWKGAETHLTSCDSGSPRVMMDMSKLSNKDGKLIFTYDVTFTKSNVRWASRWDVYIGMQNTKIHWFSIVNSLMIVIFLTTMVAMILLRTVYQDLARYNQIDQSLESQVEETGWKLLHGDVFRAPPRPQLLAVLVGTGAQVFGMAVVTIFGAALGFLSPANRGSLMTAILLLFVMMGYIAGYISNRMYAFFGLENWRSNAVHTAIAFPGINFSVFFLFNLILWAKNSSGAVPFFELFALLILWFGISVPLVYLGAYVSHSKPPMTAPVRVNTIPRMVPQQPWYMQTTVSVLVAGVLPFGAVFIEAFFIFTSIWQHQFYYFFGFLFLVFMILVITCVEISIVMCYLQLCGEDHHWWWRAYLTSGSSALYLFLYSLLYFFTRLDVTRFFPAMLYFGYSALIAGFFFVLTGSVGFLSTFFFVKKIYSALKIE